MVLSIPVSSIVKPTSMISPRPSIGKFRFGCLASLLRRSPFLSDYLVTHNAVLAEVTTRAMMRVPSNPV
jgi:hypothetical protein